jgi:hypothetical protein
MAEFVGDEKEGEIPRLEPLSVLYCPHCSMPPEYCEHGPCPERCLPWIQQNCPEIVGTERLAELMSQVKVSGGEGDNTSEAVAVSI